MLRGSSKMTLARHDRSKNNSGAVFDKLCAPRTRIELPASELDRRSSGHDANRASDVIDREEALRTGVRPRFSLVEDEGEASLPAVDEPTRC
jgi:hypothetical protein